MSAAKALKELLKIGVTSDGRIIKRCVKCSSPTTDSDKDCPVCRAIILLRNQLEMDKHHDI